MPGRGFAVSRSTARRCVAAAASLGSSGPVCLGMSRAAMAERVSRRRGGVKLKAFSPARVVTRRVTRPPSFHLASAIARRSEEATRGDESVAAGRERMLLARCECTALLFTGPKPRTASGSEEACSGLNSTPSTARSSSSHTLEPRPLGDRSSPSSATTSASDPRSAPHRSDKAREDTVSGFNAFPNLLAWTSWGFHLPMRPTFSSLLPLPFFALGWSMVLMRLL
mmetsp:Transcript_49580/g.116913  ORF Transcript_49580/g.116913 Transcript_49580/m.116913 type:complete len:225 (-) Transcript_49580:1460-2134(-)